ncbi:hypothetical protein MKW98_016449 [Papaver atlanticum]|uniref:KIB1-4 beta-propeller domain-containing protein n=1 Tax=Papaver atlanticum TaxID=357466 RepID=A0AAD4XTV1_9MAGN|nr:hypothetical protein MKW98_016449 [Papaver atlanticum]
MEERASIESPNGAPWLVFPYGEGKKHHALYNICEPDNTNCRNFIPELSGKTFWQKTSHQGWLIVLCDVKDDNSMPNCKYGDCFLWNPLTLETIQLPSLLKWITSEPDGEYMLDCVLSSPPRTTANSNGSDPLVLVIYLPMSAFESPDDYTYTFLFCHPGEKQWRTQLLSERIDEHICEIEYLHCFKGKLYAMGINGDCLEIEEQHLVGANDNNVSLSMRSFHVADNTSVPSYGVARDTLLGMTYFVEGHDDIFMISMNFNDSGSERVVISICITRLDFFLMEWKLVNTLGDDVLFVGRKNRLCCSAAKLGLARGCLYYTLPVHQLDEFCLPMGSQISSKGMGLYKFEVEGAGDYDISPRLSLSEPVFATDWIIMPDGQRGKEAKLSISEGDQDYISKAGVKKISLSGYNDSENEGAKQLVSHMSALELEEERHWGILNEDMVVLIASYLHPLDYVHFRSVCKVNRQIMPVVKPTFTSIQIFETSHLSPWLLFSEDNSSSVYNLVNPMHDNENYLMNFSELLFGATIRFHKGGWLLMSREDELFFYNPFTREVIKLPDLPGCYYRSDISFSSVPTASDCVVFAIEGRLLSDDCEFSIHCIKRGKQEWDFFDFDEQKYSPYWPLRNTPISFDGEFYSVGYDGVLGNFNLENDGYNWKVFEKPQQQFKDSYPSFLVKCGDNLLLVKLGCLEMPVRLFKLDFAEMEWVKVESLGKHMLFISDIACFSAIAPNNRMENKIYFPRLCLNGEGVLFYSLETGNYHFFGTQHVAKNFCGTKGWLRNCTWIEPNWSKSTAQELDWFAPPSLP